MKKIYILIVIVFTLIFASAGYTASPEETESEGSPSTMGMSEDMSEMMGKKQGSGMMHQGMMSHHMKHSGVSPVTIMIQPGMMPMMGHGMMSQGENRGHRGDGMSQETMQERHEMMKKHMERMERRMENIEELLRELVELQRQN